MPNRHSRILLFLSFLSACSRGSVQTEPEPVAAETPATAPANPLSSRTSWVIAPSSQPHRYRSTTTAVIEQNELSSSMRDSVTSTADFSLALSRDSRSLTYNATIRGVQTTGSSRTASAGPVDQYPISITGRLEGNRFSGELPSECSTQSSSAASVIQRLVQSIPVQLRKDQTWTDSTSAKVCSGSIPVVLTSVRSYRVLGETETRGQPALRLSREDRTTSQGEGSEGQHRIQLQSSGIGRGEIIVDRTTGALLESSTTSTVNVTVTASGRVQRFIQTSREIVVEQN